MDYDENVFKAKANIKARRIWLVFALLLSANYGTDVRNGGYPGSQYIIFLILCWVPFFAGEILLKVDGKTTDRYRFDLFIGYGIFYTFLICFDLYHSFSDCLYLHPSGSEYFGSL